MAHRIYEIGKDEAAVLDLRAKVWGVDHPHTSAAFYKWLFEDTPDGAGSGIVVEHNGRIIGFAGLANRRAQIGEALVKVSHGLDFMVDPALSGMLAGRTGIRIIKEHTALTREMGFDLTLNYPNDNSYRMLVANPVKFTPVFVPDLFVCALRPVSIKEGGLAKRMAFGVASGIGALYGAGRSLGTGRKIDIEPVTFFDERFDDHWNEMVKDGQLRFFRDAKTLTWRYSKNPLYSYHIISAVQGGRIIGYAVASKRELFGIETLLICDLAVANHDPRTEGALLDGIKQIAKGQGAGLVLTQALRDSQLAGCLGRGGFVIVPPRFNPKTFRMVNIANTDLGKRANDPAAWAFSWGDMDVI